MRDNYVKSVFDRQNQLHPFLEVAQSNESPPLRAPLGNARLKTLDPSLVDGSSGVIQDRDFKDSELERFASLVMTGVGVFHKHGIAIRNVRPETFCVSKTEELGFAPRVCDFALCETFAKLDGFCDNPKHFEVGMGACTLDSPWASPEEVVYWNTWRSLNKRKNHWTSSVSPPPLYNAHGGGDVTEHPAAKTDAWSACLVALYLFRRRRHADERDTDVAYTVFTSVAREALWPVALEDCESYVDAYIRYLFDPFIEDESWEKERRGFRDKQQNEASRFMSHMGSVAYFAKRPAVAKTVKNMIRLRSFICKQHKC